MTKREKSKVDREALDRITKRVLAYRPSKHRKKKKDKQAKQVEQEKREN